MNINADLIIKLRSSKPWSQDELATASGLSLRTVQRIESEASASIQSKKAIASALEVNIRDLDFVGIPIMNNIEEIAQPLPFQIDDTVGGLVSNKGIFALERDGIYLVYETLLLGFIPYPGYRKDIRIPLNEVDSIECKKRKKIAELLIKVKKAHILKNWPLMNAGCIALKFKNGYIQNLEKITEELSGE